MQPETSSTIDRLISLTEAIPLAERAGVPLELRTRVAKLGDPFIMSVFGRRVPHKNRAETSKELRRATPAERQEARLLAQSLPDHEVQALFAERHIRITANWLSRSRGANR